MTFEEVRKQLSSSKPPVIFTSDDDELNRRIIEKLEINIFLINQAGRKDFQKQRNSGFNQVMAKIAKKKGIAIDRKILATLAKDNLQTFERLVKSL